VLLHAAVTKPAVTSTAAMLTWRPVKFVSSDSPLTRLRLGQMRI